MTHLPHMYMICWTTFSFHWIRAQKYSILQFPQISQRSWDHIRSFRAAPRFSWVRSDLLNFDFFWLLGFSRIPLIWALQSLLALESRRRGGWLQNHRAEAEKPRCTALKAGKQEEAEAEQAGADAWEARRRSRKDRIWSQERREIRGNYRIILELDKGLNE